MKKVRWGVIGAGGIADRRTIPGMMQCENAELVAVMEINMELAEKCRAKWGCKRAYDSEAALLARMHAAGIVHGDVHERNFVLRKKADAAGGEEVVAIDMSGKRATPFTRAEDRIRLEWTFGVKNALDDWGAKMFLAKRRLRNFVRRLRGKPQLRA